MLAILFLYSFLSLQRDFFSLYFFLRHLLFKLYLWTSNNGIHFAVYTKTELQYEHWVIHTLRKRATKTITVASQLQKMLNEMSKRKNDDDGIAKWRGRSREAQKKNGVYTMRKWYIQCWWRDVNDIAKCLLPHQIENYDKETIERERKKNRLSHLVAHIIYTIPRSWSALNHFGQSHWGRIPAKSSQCKCRHHCLHKWW